MRRSPARLGAVSLAVLGPMWATSPVSALAADPADATPPVITHRPVTAADPGSSVTVRATIRDPAGVAFPRLHFRKAGDKGYSVATMVPGATDEHVAQIPAFVVTQRGVEYYVEAFDKLGNGPAYHGKPDAPHSITVRAPAKPSPAAGGPAATPWYGRWWVWTIAGAVVAGSAVAIVAATVGSDEGSGNGNGTPQTTLTVEAPLPGPTLPGF